jgi:ABC-type transport system substrate-binding protein
VQRLRVLSVPLVIILLCAFALPGCAPAAQAPAPAPKTASPAGEGQPKSGGSIRFAAMRDAIAFDPHISQGISNSWLMGNVYDTLVEYNEQGEFMAALAESWSQPDAKTYVFKLRKNVKFQDGSTFDAADVVATINRIKDPATAAVHKVTMDNIVKIETPDDLTIRLVLKDIDPTFMNVFAGSAAFMVSSDDVKKGVDLKRNMNGTGPFKLASWEPNREYVLKRNPDYWDKGLPYLDQIVIEPVPDTEARVNALKSGRAEIADYVPWQAITTLQKDFAVHVDYGSFNYIRVNPSKPPLNNKSFRQALNYIIDRKAMTELAWGGMAKVMDGPLQLGGSQYYLKELEGRYKKDWNKAKELLKAAGFASPADVPELELGTTTNAVLMETGQVALQQLKDFGLKIKWKTFDSATLISNRTQGTYMLQQDGGGWASEDPDSMRTVFHSKFGSSYAAGVKYKNDRLDQLLEEGLRTIDVQRRKQIYLEVENILLDESVYIFELWRPQADSIAKYLKGWKRFPDALANNSYSTFEHLWSDKPK